MTLAVGLIVWPPEAKTLVPTAITETVDGQIKLDPDELVEHLFDPLYKPVVQQSIRDGTFYLDIRRTAPSRSLQSAADEFLTIWYTRRQNSYAEANKKFEVYGVASLESVSPQERTPTTRATLHHNTSHYSPTLYLVVVGNQLDLPHRHSIGYIIVPSTPDQSVKTHLHAPIMPGRVRIMAPVKYMVWGALVVPFLGIFVFFDISPTNDAGGFWSRLGDYVVTNLQFAVVFAFIGAVGGFCTGMFVAVRGRRS